MVVRKAVALYLVFLVSDKLIFSSSVDVLGENWEEEYYFQTFLVLDTEKKYSMWAHRESLFI